MPATLEPMVYVCVATGFSLPLYEACIARRPSDIVLLVSTDARIVQSARRLQAQLEKELPGVRIHRPDQHAQSAHLGGDGIMESLSWIEAVLRPFLQRPEFAGKPRQLNLNGGTKAMSLALIAALRWDTLDYKATGSASMEVVALQPDEQGRQTLRPLEALALRDATPNVVAQLYNDHMQPATPNPLLAAPAAIELAAAIWDAQQTQDAGLGALFDQLETVWSRGRDTPAYRRPRVAHPLPPHLDRTALDVWLHRFNTLQAGVLYRDGDTLHMPGNAPAAAETDFVAWLSANWLEQLCHHWLVADGLPTDAVSLHLTIGEQAGNSGSQREADLVIHHRSRTRLIEVKAGLPAQRTAADLEAQLSSLGERFGQSGKALFISPRLRWLLMQRSSWESFKARCKSARVTLCDARASLREFAGLDGR